MLPIILLALIILIEIIVVVYFIRVGLLIVKKYGCNKVVAYTDERKPNK